MGNNLVELAARMAILRGGITDGYTLSARAETSVCPADLSLLQHDTNVMLIAATSTIAIRRNIDFLVIVISCKR